MFYDDSMYPYGAGDGWVNDDEFSGQINARIGRYLWNKQQARTGQTNALQRLAAGGGGGGPRRVGNFPAARGPRPMPPMNTGIYTPAQAMELARGDDVIYGLDSGATPIAAAATASLSTTPQKRHIPKKLVVSQTMANNFVLSDIRVGVEPVLATTSNLSLAIFVQDSSAPPFRAVVCEIGMDFTVTITNLSLAGSRFVATVVGTYLPPAGC